MFVHAGLNKLWIMAVFIYNSVADNRENVLSHELVIFLCLFVYASWVFPAYIQEIFL